MTEYRIDNGFLDSNNNKIVRTSDGTLHSVFLYKSNFGTTTGLFYSKSFDNGISWNSIEADVIDKKEVSKGAWESKYSKNTSLTQNTPFCPSILTDSADNIYIIWGEKWNEEVKIPKTMNQKDLEEFVENYVYSKFSNNDKKIIYNWDKAMETNGTKAPSPPIFISTDKKSGVIGSYTRKMFVELKKSKKISSDYYTNDPNRGPLGPVSENSFTKVYYKSSSDITTYDTENLQSCLTLLIILLSIYFLAFWDSPNAYFRRSWEKSSEFSGWRISITTFQMRKALESLAEQKGKTSGYYCAIRKLSANGNSRVPTSIWSCFNFEETRFLNDYFSNLRNTFEGPVVTLVPKSLQVIFDSATKTADNLTSEESKEYFYNYIDRNYLSNTKQFDSFSSDLYFVKLKEYIKNLREYNDLFDHAPPQVKSRNAKLAEAYAAISNNNIEQVIDTIQYFQIFSIKFEKQTYSTQNSWVSSNKKNITEETPSSNTPNIISSIDSLGDIHLFFDYFGEINYKRKISSNDNFSENNIVIEFGRPLASAIDSKGKMHLIYHKSPYISTIYFTDQILDIPGSEAGRGSFWKGEGLVYSRIADAFSPTHRELSAYLYKGNWDFGASVVIDAEDAAHISWKLSPYSLTPYNQELLPSSKINYTKIKNNSVIQELEATELFSSASNSAIVVDYIEETTEGSSDVLVETNNVYVFAESEGDIYYREYSYSTQEWSSPEILFSATSYGENFHLSLLWQNSPYFSRSLNGYAFIFTDATNQGGQIKYYTSSDLSFSSNERTEDSPEATIAEGENVIDIINGQEVTTRTDTITTTREDGSVSTTIVTTTFESGGLETKNIVIDESVVDVSASDLFSSETRLFFSVGSDGIIAEIIENFQDKNGVLSSTTTVEENGVRTVSYSSNYDGVGTQISVSPSLTSINGYVYSVNGGRWSVESETIIEKIDINGGQKEIIPREDYEVFSQDGIVVFKKNMEDLNNSLYKINIISPFVFRPALKVSNYENDYVRIFGVGYIYDETGDIKTSIDGDNLCSLEIRSAGMFEGYDREFDISDKGNFDLLVNYNMYSDTDRIIVYVDGTSEYDSGCVVGEGSTILPVSIASSTIRIKIIPNCLEGLNIAPHWWVRIDCIEK